MKFNLTDRLLKAVDKKRKVYPQHVNRISSIGFPCLRNCVYQITHWHEKELPSLELQLVFEEGRHQERAVKHDLEDAGIKIIRQEESVWFEAERLSGHDDGVIVHGRLQIGLEIKSMSTHMFAKINSPADLIYSDHSYHRCYVPQIQLYMRGMGLKYGIVFIKDKNSGAFKELPIVSDKGMQNFYLRKCLQVNDHVDKIKSVLSETYQIKDLADFSKQKDAIDFLEIRNEAYKLIEEYLPERIKEDCICKECPFNRICLPDEVRQERIAVWINEELEELLAKRETLKESRSEYEKLDAEVKEKIKASDRDYFVVGNFEIKVSRGKTTRIDIKNTVKD